MPIMPLPVKPHREAFVGTLPEPPGAGQGFSVQGFDAPRIGRRVPLVAAKGPRLLAASEGPRQQRRPSPAHPRSGRDELVEAIDRPVTEAD